MSDNQKVESVEKTTVKAKPADVKKPRKTASKSKVEKSSEQDKTSTASTSNYPKHFGYNKEANSAKQVKDFQAIRDSIEAKIDAFFEANKEVGLTKLISASKMMEAGAHIGMPARMWNPKMKPFIYPKKGKTQIIDILKTMVFLDRAYNFLRDITKDGGRVLIVGTRGEVIKEHIKNEAKRAKAYYVNQR